MTQELREKKWTMHARTVGSLLVLGLIAVGMGAGIRLALSPQSVKPLDEGVALAAPVPVRADVGSDAPATSVMPPVAGTNEIVKAAVVRDGFWFNADVLGRLGPQTQSLTVNGMELTVSDFHVEQGRLYVNVCVPAAGKDYRTLGMVTLILGAKTFDTYYAHENSVTETSRCEALEYVVGESPTETQDVSVSISSVYLIPPLEGQECITFEERARSSQRLVDLGITVNCIAQNGQSPRLVVEKGSSAVDQATAESIALDVYSGSVEGPWVFKGKLTP